MTMLYTIHRNIYVALHLSAYILISYGEHQLNKKITNKTDICISTRDALSSQNKYQLIAKTCIKNNHTI